MQISPVVPAVEWAALSVAGRKCLLHLLLMGGGGWGAVNWVSLLMRGSLPGRPSEVGRTEQGKGVGLLLMETRVTKTENASNCV